MVLELIESVTANSAQKKSAGNRRSENIELLEESLRQHVAQAHVAHHQVSVLGSAGGYKPRSARHVGSLRDQQDSAVLWVSPESLRPVKRGFLNGFVHDVAAGLADSAEADHRLGNADSGDVREGIALEVC